MRVLWLTHMLPYPPTGGSLLRTHHLLREAARFASVDVLAFVQPALLPSGVDADTATRELGRFCSILGVFPLPFESRRGKTLLAAWCAIRGRSYTMSWTRSRAYAEAVRTALDSAYDLLVLDTVGLGDNVPTHAGVPIVLNHHNEEVSMLERRRQTGSAWARRYYRLESSRLRAACLRLFPRVARHLVCSEPERERLRRLDPRAVADTVPNGVDTEEYALVDRRAGDDPFTLIFIGGGTWYPNRDAVSWLLREIWPRCAQRLPTARLVLLGRSPTPESLEAARRDARVIVPGYVDDIRDWCSRADVFVCPIREGGGTRLKVLHAMSMGLPLVSTTLGMEGIDSQPGVHHLEADSPEAFTAQIVRLAEHPEERHRLARAGRELAVATYDWKRVGEALRASFEHAMAGPLELAR